MTATLQSPSTRARPPENCPSKLLTAQLVLQAHPFLEEIPPHVIDVAVGPSVLALVVLARELRPISLEHCEVHLNARHAVVNIERRLSPASSVDNR